MNHQTGTMSLDNENNIKESEETLEGEVLHTQEEKTKEHAVSQKLEALKKLISEQETVDLKLQVVIDFMEETLAQTGTPHFKNFWEGRKLCIELFKENLSPGVRAHLWSKYGELTKQARALKEILDEQTSFAVEQIEIAIAALEEEVNKLENCPEGGSDIDLSKAPAALSKKFDFYGKIQHELNLINASASRINSLRKELIKTEMRIRQKNKFFQRLSSAGDKVFPKRKELIKQISQEFQADVNEFIKIHFESDEISESLFVLRDEIKKMQSFAKMLTLNTQSFTSTRLKLSTCWDKIKDKEKEWKKSRAQAKATHKENADPIREKITLVATQFEAHQLTLDNATKQLDEISNEMRQVELGRDDVHELKEAINNVKKQIQAKRRQEEEARQAQHQEIDRQRKQLFADLKNGLESLIAEAGSYNTQDFAAKGESFKEQMRSQNLSKAQKMELDPLLRSIADQISEKEENSLLNLSEGDRDALENCKLLLKQRIERRKEIKEQLDTLRKSAGSSGLDFEQAINFKQQIESEKSRLEKATLAIEEIEKKLAELKSKKV